MNNKVRVYSIIILSLLLIICSSFPITLFINNYYWVFAIKNTLRICFIIFALFYIRHELLPLPKLNRVRIKSFLIVVPFLLLCFSNFIVITITKTQINNDINVSFLVCDIISSFLVAICEEIVFRAVIMMELDKYLGTGKALIISSAIFGACHLLNISSVATIVPSLIQAVYTFVLGMVFGYIYLETENILLPIAFHFVFNVINNDLIKNLYLINWDFTFYITNIAIGLVMVIYLLFLLFLYNRNKKIKGDNYDLWEDLFERHISVN